MVTDLHLHLVALDLDLDVAALDLGEGLAVGDGHDYGLDLFVHLQFGSVDHTDAIDDEGGSNGEVESLLTAGLSTDLGDSTNDQSADGHLLVEVEVGRVAQLVEAGSHHAVVADLDEATGLADVDDVAEGEISSVKGDTCSELQNLVSHVACLLEVLVLSLELLSSTLRGDGSPCLVVNDRLSGTELGLAVLVEVNDTGHEHLLLSNVLENVAGHFVSDLAHLNETIGAFVNLDGDTTALDGLNIADNGELALLEVFLSLGGAEERELLVSKVGDFVNITDLELLALQDLGSVLHDLLLLDEVIERNLAADERRDLNLKRRRVLQVDSHGLIRGAANDHSLVGLANLQVSVLERSLSLLASKLNEAATGFLTSVDMEDFAVNLVSQVELSEVQLVLALDHVEAAEGEDLLGRALEALNLASNLQVDGLLLDAANDTLNADTLFQDLRVVSRKALSLVQNCSLGAESSDLVQSHLDDLTSRVVLLIILNLLEVLHLDRLGHTVQEEDAHVAVLANDTVGHSSVHDTLRDFNLLTHARLGVEDGVFLLDELSLKRDEGHLEVEDVQHNSLEDGFLVGELLDVVDEGYGDNTDEALLAGDSFDHGERVLRLELDHSELMNVADQRGLLGGLGVVGLLLHDSLNGGLGRQSCEQSTFLRGGVGLCLLLAKSKSEALLLLLEEAVGLDNATDLERSSVVAGAQLLFDISEGKEALDSSERFHNVPVFLLGDDDADNLVAGLHFLSIGEHSFGIFLHQGVFLREFNNTLVHIHVEDSHLEVLALLLELGRDSLQRGLSHMFQVEEPVNELRDLHLHVALVGVDRLDGNLQELASLDRSVVDHIGLNEGLLGSDNRMSIEVVNLLNLDMF
mmetsp:Transcript_1273/g.1517  ORF Transcript_1273/g.1517 Transcript_1273/m.1517 type:complete len:863 (-) Transcript_1273:1509-4097(-)